MVNFKPVLVQLALVFSFFMYANAQPSGGPYGALQQYYELPKVSGTIYFVAPNGNPEARGISIDTPTSIESAVARVVTGDAIVMRGGTYRTGNLTFNQGITIQPYRDEYPILKGTKVAENWQKSADGQWVTTWEYLFPGKPEDWWRREREEKFTPLHRFNNDGIFVDGNYLQSVGSIAEITEGTYYVDYDAKKIYIGTDPTERLVEITAFRKAIFRPNAEVHGKKPDKRGPVIHGIEITQYPDTMVHIGGDFLAIDQHGRDIVGTLFEDCTFSNCFRIGVFVIGDSLIMRNCLVTDTNTEGVYVVASEGIILEKNIFARNNIERWTGFYPAAVKIFNQCKRAVVRDNLVTDHPNSNGIWYDVGNTDGVFVNNRLQNIGSRTIPFRPGTIWHGQNAFFFEISKGVVCAGNVFVNCDNGILILNSSDAKIYQNTFVNSQAVIARDHRSAQGDHFGWHPRTGPDVHERTGHEFVNNLMYGDEAYNRPLLHVWQPNTLCKELQEPALMKLDHNVYVTYTNREPLITLSQDLNDECQHFFATPAGLNGIVSTYEKSGTSWKEYRGLLFKGLKTGNYQIDGRFKGIQSATTSPAYIRELLDSHGLPPYPGAYKP
jgi:parallel beta-helix repeat protein